MDQRGFGAADPSQDAGDARIGHQQPHRAGRAQLVEQPAGKAFEPERRAYASLEQNAVENLSADRHAAHPGDARRAGPGIHHRRIERPASEVDRHLHAAMGLLADDGGGRFRQERDLCEPGRRRGSLEPPEGFSVGRRPVARVSASEDHRMPEHDTMDGLFDGRVGLGLQSLDNDADQGRHRKIGRPRVGAGKAELGQLMLDA
jgi:hypothetical protein